MEIKDMTQAQIKRAMLDADGKRARLAYAGCGGRTTYRASVAREKLNKETPEYQEANARYYALSDALKDKSGPTDLARMLRF